MNFFFTRTGTTYSWLGGTIGGAIVVYALLGQQIAPYLPENMRPAAEQNATAVQSETPQEETTETAKADGDTQVTPDQSEDASASVGDVTPAEDADPEDEVAAAETLENGDDADNLASKVEGVATDAQPEADPATAPVFDVVRVDSQGSAVIAGRAAPNALIEIISNEDVIGTAQSDTSGAFVAFLDVPSGPKPQSIKLVATNEAGETFTSPEPVIVLGRLVDEPEITNALQEPAAEQPIVEAALPLIVRTEGETVKLVQPSQKLSSDLVTLDTITYSLDRQVLLSGRGQPGRTVFIYANGAFKGETKATGDGGWELKLDNIEEGRYVLRVDQVMSDGKVISRFETPFQREFPPAETIARLQIEKQIIVQPGNNLWTIAQNRYGSGVKYTTIFDANRSQITDPDLIYPGQVFELPEN
jgi:nucleoid-associated protein YgaU